MARTCSRPPRDVLKMRTLPRAMMCRPWQGSPSEKSNSPVRKSLHVVRAASSCNSAAVRTDSNGVFSRTAGRSIRLVLIGESLAVCNAVMSENHHNTLYLYEATRAADAPNRSHEKQGDRSP